jgi:AcrR family transcriptional regulator
MFSTPETSDLPEWRNRALSRSLGDVRARHEARLERLVEAARRLANETGSADFTVAQVVAEAGLSLKSFYACFDGKDDLLCALLEEDSRIGASAVAAKLAPLDSPERRLRTFVDTLLEFAALPDARGYAAVLVREYHRLADQARDAHRASIAPLVGLLAGEIDGAMRAGLVRSGDPMRDSRTVFGMLLGEIADLVLNPGSPPADPEDVGAYLWEFLWRGLTAPPADRTSSEER